MITRCPVLLRFAAAAAAIALGLSSAAPAAADDLDAEAVKFVQKARALDDQNKAFERDYGGRDLPTESREAQTMLTLQAVLDKADADYQLEVNAFLSKKITALDAAVKKDVLNIRALNFDAREEQFDEWADLAAEARSDLNKQTLDALISTGMSGAQAGAGIAASTNPWNANKMIARLQAAGADNPHLIEAIRAVGATRGKPEAVKAANDFLDAISKAKDANGIRESALSAKTPIEQRNAGLEAIATVLSWGLEDPKLSLLVTELQLTTAAVYNNAARHVAVARVEQLTKLTEDDLKRLKLLIKRLKAHVDDRRRIRAALESKETPDKVRALLPMLERPAEG
ncbi:MAG: hypothetical protein QOF78_3137 [Phycisphaerales bacterium]|jgi:hypothetical protein|nr:hypothetical protein [Phycisphaerales bacterium]